ncbi:hypothetical protein ETB97_001155 [Aspergillus alliaceus]|uniref:Uncharacterized protein n=1 Tax=Petromyces alliaceus TaxID=209559 RepID=A0A8H6ACR3_PETAA|nr:hypothetical protein ETB97_001155 [Aspergillus burnettii]
MSLLKDLFAVPSHLNSTKPTNGRIEAIGAMDNRTDDLPWALADSFHHMALQRSDDTDSSKKINSIPDRVGSTKTTISPLQPALTPPSHISPKEPTVAMPPIVYERTGLPYPPRIRSTFDTVAQWAPSLSLDSTTTAASEPTTPSTLILTTNPSTFRETEANSSSNGGLSTKTTIAIVVPVSLSRLAIFNEHTWDYAFTPTERTSFATMIPRSPYNQSPPIPDTQSLNRELPPPPSSDSCNGAQGRFTEQVHSMYAPAGAPIALTEVNSRLHEQHASRTSQWPLSPFGDAANRDGDAVPEVSKLSDRLGTTQNRDLDDMSSISSIDDNDR